MKSTHPLALLLMLVMLAGVTSACSGVTPIGLHDTYVPLEGRKLVADAQDAVSIARARLDDAKALEAEVKKWEGRFGEGGWPEDAGAKTALGQLSAARLELANLERSEAEIALELAEGKLELVTAQTAIRHDLATYELEPLRKRVEGTLARLADVRGGLGLKRKELDDLTAAWWEKYSAMVKGDPQAASQYFGAAILE